MKALFHFSLPALLLAVLVINGPRAGAQGFGLSVAASAPSLLVSNSLTYTISVTNLNEIPLADTLVTNSLSAPFQFGGAAGPSGSTYSTNGNTVVLDLGSYFSTYLEVAQLTLTVQPTETGSFANAVTVGSITVTNLASTNVVVLVTNVAPTLADLGVAVAGPAQPVVTNDWMSYTVTASNAGPDLATGVALTNTLPSGVILRGATPANYSVSSSNLIFNFASLAAGAFTNFQFTLQPTNVGPLTLSASIGSGVQDTNTANNFASANFSVTNYAPGQFVVYTNSPQIYDMQNNLVEQTVAVRNVGASAVDAVRVVVAGLTNRLFNAVGTNDSNPFVVYDGTLPPKQSVQMLLQFAANNYFPLTNSQLQAFGVLPPDWTAPSATSFSTNVNITSITRLSSGRMLLWFPSISNRTYTVVYSDSLSSTNWLMAQPPVVAPTTYTEWMDYGPPGTVSAPANTTNRFYRVFLNP